MDKDTLKGLSMIKLPIHFRLVLVLAILAFACSSAENESIGINDEDVIEIVETTNVVINCHQVAVANIWKRELPDAEGTIAMRMSAIMSIMDDATQEEWTLTVIESDSVELGDRTYCVSSIAAEEGSRGLLTLTEMLSDQIVQ